MTSGGAHRLLRRSVSPSQDYPAQLCVVGCVESNFKPMKSWQIHNITVAIRVRCVLEGQHVQTIFQTYWYRYMT